MNAAASDKGLFPGAVPEDPTVDYDPFAEGTLSRVAPTTEPQREVWLADLGIAAKTRPSLVLSVPA